MAVVPSTLVHSLFYSFSFLRCFRSGRLDYCTAISLFDYIDQEREYLPWKAAIDGISIIGSSLTRTKPGKKYYMVRKNHLRRLRKFFVNVNCFCLRQVTNRKSPKSVKILKQFLKLVQY